MQKLTHFVATPVAALATACGGADDLATDSAYDWNCPDGACIRLGVGETSFEPMTNGQALSVTTGVQGGAWLPVSLQVVGIDPGLVETPDSTNPVVDFDLLRGSETVDAVVAKPIPFSRVDGSPEKYQLLGFHVCLAEAVLHDLAGLDGSRLRLVADVTDKAGVQRRCEIEITATVPNWLTEG